MLGHCKMILEQDPGKIAINPDKFDKPITASRTAVDNETCLNPVVSRFTSAYDSTI